MRIKQNKHDNKLKLMVQTRRTVLKTDDVAPLVTASKRGTELFSIKTAENGTVVSSSQLEKNKKQFSV